MKKLEDIVNVHTGDRVNGAVPYRLCCEITALSTNAWLLESKVYFPSGGWVLASSVQVDHIHYEDVTDDCQIEYSEDAHDIFLWHKNRCVTLSEIARRIFKFSGNMRVFKRKD